MAHRKINNKLIHVSYCDYRLVHLDLFCLWKVVFLEIIFKIILFFILLEKLVNEKYFSVKKKFNVIFKKKFFFYFREKYFLEVVKKIKNIMLFIDYIKFNIQTFNCYIFYFSFFFNFIV
jgi:hypothetical protein